MYIGIPEIIITDRTEDDKHLSIKYTAEAAERPVCPNPDCFHKYTPQRHDKTHYLLHDIKAEGKLVYIDLILRRYKCPECQSVFPDEFSFFTKRQHMTHRLKEEFVNRCLKGETFRYIANDYSVDTKTVISAFKEYIDKNKEKLDYNYTPEVLGIDEAHIDDHYRLVLTDVKEQRLLDMKRDNRPRTVRGYLKTLDKTVCKCVTMDFAPEYASAVAEVLPSAVVVIDKFHAIQDINRCLDKARRRIQNQYIHEKGISKGLKRAKYLFMSNWEDLSPAGEATLSAWFCDVPELYEAYMCKETFRDIYISATNKRDAVQMFEAWIKSVPPILEFQPMRKTMLKRKEHILNYWDYNWTNAYTESVNNAIKTIEKRGRGYKFDRLRELCILEINKPKTERFNPKTATYLSSDEEKQRRRLYTKCLNELTPQKTGAEVKTPARSGSVRVKPSCTSKELFEIYVKNMDAGFVIERTPKFDEAAFLMRMKAYYDALRQRNLIS